MSEQIVEVKATSGGMNNMVYTTALEGRTLQQVAEQAGRDWEDAFEERYSDPEGLRIGAEGFSISVCVDGQAFAVSMRPTISWVVEATPESQ